MAQGMGFTAAAKSIAAKGGYSIATARRILAYSSRNASASAKSKNQNLRKVKMKKKGA